MKVKTIKLETGTRDDFIDEKRNYVKHVYKDLLGRVARIQEEHEGWIIERDAKGNFVEMYGSAEGSGLLTYCLNEAKEEGTTGVFLLGRLTREELRIVAELEDKKQFSFLLSPESRCEFNKLHNELAKENAYFENVGVKSSMRTALSRSGRA